MRRHPPPLGAAAPAFASVSRRWSRWLAAGAACWLGCGGSPRSPAQLEPAQLTRLEGNVQLPNGAALAYAAILVADPKAPGSYLGTIDIPQQALSGATLERVRFLPGEHVEFELGASGTPRWIGHYNADGSVECRFVQADRTLPCSMQEVTSRAPRAPVPPLARQTPQPPFPYQVVEVRLENPAAHAMLAGTLTLPSGPGPHAGVLLISDAGPQDRDGSSGRHKPLLVLADHLTRSGLAVLRLDDRGTGGSDAGPPDPSASDLEGDVTAAIAFLKQRPEVDAAQMGLLGIGAGAALAARALMTHPELSFLVQLALPVSADPAAGRAVLALRAEEVPGYERWAPPAAEAVGADPADAADDAADAADDAETLAPATLNRVSEWILQTARR